MSHGKPKDPPFEEDAARLAAEPGHGPDDFEGFDTGGATVEFARRFVRHTPAVPAGEGGGGGVTPTERRLRAQIAAHTSWANTADRTARTAPGHKASMDRFERQVDPDGTLAPAERAKRAESARKAYFARLALLSAKARAAKKARRATTALLTLLLLTGCPASSDVQTDVRPGSFCSPSGAEGRTADGAAVRCTTAPDDPRDRWRR